MFQTDMSVHVFEPKVSISTLFAVLLSTISVGSIVRVVADRALQ